MPKFRFAHMIPYTSGGWVTVQRDDYFPLRWSQVKSHQEELHTLIAKEEMVKGGIGDCYSPWHDWSELPEWAIEPLERESIA